MTVTTLLHTFPACLPALATRPPPPAVMTADNPFVTAVSTPPPSGAATLSTPRAGHAAYVSSLPPCQTDAARLCSDGVAALCPRRPPLLPRHHGGWRTMPLPLPSPVPLFAQPQKTRTSAMASRSGRGGAAPRPRRSAADKAAFWDTVESRVGPTTPGLSRFWAFAETARGERPRPPRHTLPPTYRPGREYYPGLPPPVPVVDMAGVGWVDALAAATPAIQAELAAVTGEEVGGRGAAPTPGANPSGGTQGAAGAVFRPHAAVHLGGWSALQLRWEGVQPTSSPLPRMPATAAAVAGAPLAPRSLAFARQAPGTGIAPHSDGLNFILTAHLGCVVPDPPGSAWIHIGDQRVAWTEGGVVLLDTAFVHKTWNGAARPRVVLVADVWHPDLSAAEVAALDTLYACCGCLRLAVRCPCPRGAYPLS